MSFQNVSFKYSLTSDWVVRNLSFSIAKGQRVCLVGKSGAGKSTILKMCAELLVPSTGTIQRASPRVDYAILAAYMFQDNRLLPWRTIRRNVELGCERFTSREQRRELAQSALFDVGLEGYGDRWPYQLSGGQQQRVSLARALVSKAPILLLDEPFSSVDRETRLDVIDLLDQTLSRHELTLLFSSHDPMDAERLNASLIEV